MRNFLKIAYASAFLLVGLGTAISEPIFLHDGWAAFKRKEKWLGKSAQLG